MAFFYALPYLPLFWVLDYIHVSKIKSLKKVITVKQSSMFVRTFDIFINNFYHCKNVQQCRSFVTFFLDYLDNFINLLFAILCVPEFEEKMYVEGRQRGDCPSKIQ